MANIKKYENIMDLGGLWSSLPDDKIPMRNASDILNIDLSEPGLIQTKKGYEIYGKQDTTIGECTRSFLYRKNYGTLLNVKLVVTDDGTNSVLKWHNADHPDDANGKLETLVSGLTTGAIMGFAPINGDQGAKVNKLAFCNAAENFSTWNGATGTVASVTSNTIVINETIATEGFDTSSGSVLIDGTEYAYTGTSASTFTGVTPDPTVQAPTAGYGVASKPDTTTLSGNSKGNIFTVTMGKIFMAGVDNGSKVEYSKTSNPTGTVSATDFTIGSGALGDGGTFDIMEGGGGINFMEPKGKNGVLIHKDDFITLYRRETDGTNALENFDTIASGPSVGATNLKANTAINKTSYYCSGVEGLKKIFRSIQADDMDTDSLSDIILPSIKDWDFSDASVTYFADKQAIYISANNSDGERRVISYYIRKDANGNYVGDFSIDDEPAADWISQGQDLFFVSSVDQNIYQEFERFSANGVGRNHRWTSKSFTLNEPALGKEFDTLYLEGFIRERTKIKISIIYGTLGADGEKSVVLSWDDTSQVYDSKVSALGSNSLGTLKLGGISDSVQDSYPFSCPIHFDANKSTRFKVRIETYYDSETNDESYWAISNIGFNPHLGNVMLTRTKNSNI